MSEREHPLAQLRDQIDEVDRQLVALLARRKALVAGVGETKSRLGLPVYVPEREAALIAARRTEAEHQGVSPDMIEDVLRRIMRESYSAEGQLGFKPTAPELGPIVVVGGGNGMGALFVEHFMASNYQVRILEKDDWPRAAALLEGAELVLISVPIHFTAEVIDQVAPFLPPHCLLADVTSIKAMPLRRMLTVHQGPVVGLHPMFGPSAGTFAKQLVIHCPGRNSERAAWLLDQLRIWGAGLLASDPETHDHMMGTIQAMRHFATFVYGSHLQREGIELEKVLAFSSPIYRLELGMVGRLFAQDPNLYADIIFSSVEGREIAERFLHRFAKELEVLRSGNREAFVARFREVSGYFGSHAERFLKESSFMLEKVFEKYGDRPHAPQNGDQTGGDNSLRP